MTDIVKRLRSFDVFNAPMDIEGVMVSPVALMAADEIVRLREERDTARTQAANADAQCERDAEQAKRLRNALSELLGVVDWANASLASGEDEQWIHGQLMRAAGHARIALKGDDQ